MNNSLLYYYVVAKKRYLFIDAFNVMHAFEDLARTFYRSMDSARDKLTERVASIHEAEGIHTVLIFGSRSDLLEVDYPFGNKTFEFVYSPANLSTNKVVEQLLNCISEPARITVASNDAIVRESARANGAIAISAEDLYNWVCSCERRLVKDVERWRTINEKEWSSSIQRPPALLG